jgi:hypothetical protein
VEQPPDFESKEYPNHVYKLYKVLCGLKQAPRAGMNDLGIFLLIMVLGLERWILRSSLEGWGKNYLYVKYMLIISFLVLLINLLCDEFSKIMTDKFEISMMGEPTFFLGFQIKQVEDGTFNS